MGSRILIVEDQFIEANDLRIILEKAGHRISGIAKSVEMAQTYLAAKTTDIVLLDIFLSGKLTGIDLGKTLSAENIPFIYLSANSNPSTLESAKATQPYGFLVKPFREKDILIALDVAMYRHNYMLEQMGKQQRWLANTLTGITESGGSKNDKMVRLVRALKSFFPFDRVVLDTDVCSSDLGTIYGFERVGYDEYTYLSATDFVKQSKGKLSAADFTGFRNSRINRPKPEIILGSDFEKAASTVRVYGQVKYDWTVSSNLWMPVFIPGKPARGISFYSTDPNGFSCEHIELLLPVVPLLYDILEDIAREPDVAVTLAEDVRTDEAEEKETPSIRGIVGKSSQLLQVLDQVTQVAAYETSILILGETGVGKEGIARAIHELSNRRSKPLVKVNCASIPATLIESELFGHEKGSFTGANERRIGKFEQAQGGTIFLDEIGEIPLELQSKLLRVLQEKEIERIGGRTTINIDVRIITATNRNLHKEVAEGTFRIDLYYRLNVFPLILPPLRERAEDIPLLAAHFLQQFADKAAEPVKELSGDALQQLMDYDWPGNIRELEHLIERNILLNDAAVIPLLEMPDTIIPAEAAPVPSSKFRSMADVDKDHILAALEKTNGKISGKGGAAEILNMPATTLNAKMKKLGIGWKFLFE